MTVKTAKERPGLAGMEAFFVIDQNRSSANWPLAKILQRHGDAETGFKGNGSPLMRIYREGPGARFPGFSAARGRGRGLSVGRTRALVICEVKAGRGASEGGSVLSRI